MSTLEWTHQSFNELTTHQLYAILKLRSEVFVLEQDCPYIDPDGRDIEATHLAAWESHSTDESPLPQVIAYARIFTQGSPHSPGPSIGRVVVHPNHRKSGLGRELMIRAIQATQKQAPQKPITISAQAYLEKFYHSLGFQTISDQPYMEDWIPHVRMVLTSKVGKADWNNTFGNSEYYYGTEPNDFLRSVCDQIPAQSKVLCLAEGEGRNAVFLAKNGHTVTAIDLSTEGQKKALMLAEKNHVTLDYRIEGALYFDLPHQSMDAVVMVFLHMPASSHAQLFQKIDQTLKPGGLFIAEVYRPEQLQYGTGGPSSVEAMFRLRDFANGLPQYQPIIARDAVREIHEGTGHHGKSETVQILFRKPL